MTRPFNIRRTLLAAVDGFLEASPASLAKAHRLVARCYHARRYTSLDEVVWGPLIMELTDSVFYEDRPTLHRYRALLAEGTPEIHRVYLNFDFRPDFTAVERVWYESVLDLLDFLGGFPFPEMDSALRQYERRMAEIEQSMRQSPPPKRLGEEMIYHLILREVSAILLHVDLRYALLRSTHLVPRAPYSSMPPQPEVGRDDMPDIAGDLDWARRALGSIVEQGWLLLTWQVTPDHYLLSLH